MAQDWIPDAELDVLKLLWSEHPLTARQITIEVYGEATPSNIGTVQKLLQRLEAKSCVERDRAEHVHRFSPGVSQMDVAASQLERLAEKVADGSLAPLSRIWSKPDDSAAKRRRRFVGCSKKNKGPCRGKSFHTGDFQFRRRRRSGCCRGFVLAA
jgi:predicted transcriptional regulator